MWPVPQVPLVKDNRVLEFTKEPHLLLGRESVELLLLLVGKDEINENLHFKFKKSRRVVVPLPAHLSNLSPSVPHGVDHLVAILQSGKTVTRSG